MPDTPPPLFPSHEYYVVWVAITISLYIGISLYIKNGAQASNSNNQFIEKIVASLVIGGGITRLIAALLN